MLLVVNKLLVIGGRTERRTVILLVLYFPSQVVVLSPQVVSLSLYHVQVHLVAVLQQHCQSAVLLSEPHILIPQLGDLSVASCAVLQVVEFLLHAAFSDLCFIGLGVGLGVAAFDLAATRLQSSHLRYHRLTSS